MNLKPTSFSLEKDYWNYSWGDMPLLYSADAIRFKSLFEQYVKPASSCFEVGCFPGQYLIYLAKTFNVSVAGIDFADRFDDMYKLFQREEITPRNLYCADFRAWESNEQFDFVYSLGFVEHFADFEQIIEKHIALVKPGGTLMITCPNFRYVQYALHRTLDKSLLERHYIPSMNLKLWKKILSTNGMTILEDGYLETFRFWSDTRQQSSLSRQITKYVKRIGNRINSRFDFPNPITSPYMYSISIKPSK